MGILIKEGGILTTVQDAGRFKYQKFGVSPAGPMDSRSFFLANILVGNHKEASGLEATFQGPVLEFTEANVIAVTGGDLTPLLDGEGIPSYQAIAVQKGQVLSFGGLKSGCRAYIAFDGGLKVKEVMESQSTLIRNHLGGVDGRKLEKDDYISFAAPRASLPGMAQRILPREVFPPQEVFLRVVRGPQDHRFTAAGLRNFFRHSGVISNEFDRMGCRLEYETPIEHLTDGNIITDGIAFGSIQVPTNGQPIIMLADRQSTGGYTKIATVIENDLPLLAQCRPGYRVHFVDVSIATAQTIYIRELNRLQTLEEKWFAGDQIKEEQRCFK